MHMRHTCISIASGLLALASCNAGAQIVYGPYTFDNDAFADRVQVNEPGGLSFNQATGLDAAILGFSFDSSLLDIGSPRPDGSSLANDFTLIFDDLIASDGPGPDIILFDLRYSADPYEISVFSGGGESAVIAYAADDQVSTGRFNAGGTAWAIEIDLADYGVAYASAIRFRALPDAAGETGGEPQMAGVLNATPPDCALADTNGDGVTTPADFSGWIIAFNTGAPECDQNGDGLCAPCDFSAWILNFNTCN